ncbi:MAG: choice-of-anchor J domain-containing protein [Phycisphaerales bacterium]
MPCAPCRAIACVFVLIAATAVVGTAHAQSPRISLDEGFESVPSMFTGDNPWSQSNRSEPPGTDLARVPWRQGSAAFFGAQGGPSTSFIVVTFESAQGTGTISNWLVTPTLLMHNGDVLSFSTRTVSSIIFPDRMQVRMSEAGDSLDLGEGAFGVGDFSRLLLEINPHQLDAPAFRTDDPDNSTYPNTWTDFSITIDGLTAPTVGRIGFRYFVMGGGTTGESSQAIAIDSLTYTPVPVPGAALLLGGAGLLAGRRRR